MSELLSRVFWDTTIKCISVCVSVRDSAARLKQKSRCHWRNIIRPTNDVGWITVWNSFLFCGFNCNQLIPNICVNSQNFWHYNHKFQSLNVSALDVNFLLLFVLFFGFFINSFVSILIYFFFAFFQFNRKDTWPMRNGEDMFCFLLWHSSVRLNNENEWIWFQCKHQYLVTFVYDSAKRQSDFNLSANILTFLPCTKSDRRNIRVHFIQYISVQ